MVRYSQRHQSKKSVSELSQANDTSEKIISSIHSEIFRDETGINGSAVSSRCSLRPQVFISYIYFDQNTIRETSSILNLDAK